MNSTRDKKLLKKLGAHIKLLRQNKDVSLRHLADEADVDFSQIHRIEKGDSNPTYTMLLKLAGALGISIQELVTVE